MPALGIVRSDRRCHSADRRAVLPRPRLAHCRTCPFFWPIRASSSSQISIGVVSGRPSRCASARAGNFFKRLNDPFVLCRVTRPCAHVREAEFLQ